MALSLGFNLDWVQRALRDVLTPNRSSGIAFVNRSSILDPEVSELGVVTCLFFSASGTETEGWSLVGSLSGTETIHSCIR